MEVKHGDSVEKTLIKHTKLGQASATEENEKQQEK